MSITVTQAKESLSAMLHGGSLKRVRNQEALFERAANTMLSKIDPTDTIRTAGLSNTVHDDIYNYSLPSDFKKIIDLFPQSERTLEDTSGRRFAEKFDLTKAVRNRTISIEGSEGGKILRINWRNRQGKVLHTGDSLTNNGTWAVVATASGLELDTITKYSGNGSIRFDVNASGDGIKNISMTAVDMTNEDEVADVFVWVYLPAVTNLTSISARWGNDVSTKYWSSTAQTTQADGTAFKIGWNLLKFSWSAATETGTVDPTAIDSFQITFTTTGAIANVRVDNILFSIGRNFDIKYYSKFIFKNTSGTWLSRFSSDDDTIVLDNDAIQIYLLEILIAAAQQVEGSDSGFDVQWANGELYGGSSKPGLYARYKAENPGQGKKAIGSYGSNPGRGRW